MMGHYFPGDDLFRPTAPRGLPIGNLTTGATFYMHELDKFVKHECKAPAYLRYMGMCRLPTMNAASRLEERRQ